MFSAAPRGSARARFARIAARLCGILVIVLLCSLTGGCYLLESAQGQMALLSKRQPIDRVIDKTSTPPALRRELEEVTAIRDFASRELGLPNNGSYRSYADVGRSYVVWTVVAAPEFSVDANRWCYPIVGCVAYRGYFVEARAQRFALDLRARGFDVSLTGVAAYSTLGHFNDPILNTMVGWGDIELASIIFHELTHQMIYVPGDADFNEALAVTVQEEGVRRWLRSQGRMADLARHETQQRQELQVIQLLTRTRDALRGLYASRMAAPQMREQKQAILAAVRGSYEELTAQWDERVPFESWFPQGINNAYLASLATYYDCLPGFERELQQAGGDLNTFYRRVRALARLHREQRDAVVCRKN
jgi:predicted aminopeptidase